MNQRNFEANQETLRNEQMFQNEELALIAEANKMNQANQQIRQMQQKSAQETREAQLEAKEQKGTILATGRIGANVANLLADVNSELGKYIDHFKGDRKDSKSSKAEDIRKTPEMKEIDYWLTFMPSRML